MIVAGPARRGTHASAAALVCCAVLSAGWLTLGVLVAVAAASPAVARGLATAAAEGDAWARGVLAGVPHSEPISQLVPDVASGLLALALAGALLVSGAHRPAQRLLGVALAASAAAFHLQSSAASQALATATGIDSVGVVPRLVLPVVTCVAYVLAMVWAPRSDPTGRPGRLVIGTATGVAGVAVLGALVLPVSVRTVLLAGIVLPLIGIAGVGRQLGASTSERLRAPARLVFGVLVAGLAVQLALAAVTGLLAWLRLPGLSVVDPTAVVGATSAASGPPLVLWFWASQLFLPILAVAVLAASRRFGAESAERWFSRGLVVVLGTALLGCLYVTANILAGSNYVMAHILAGSGAVAIVVAEGAAVAVSALAFLPVFLLAERVADRLLYGTRPAPYSALVGLIAPPRTTSAGDPDLAGIAEAVGRGLGATTCRLTVHRPGLRDRSYQWVRPGEEEAEALVEVPSRHGGQEVGTIAIDRAAIAGADDQRQFLLEAVANSLGVVLEAARAGIDLERQMRAALAHATEIAAARRRAVAEADSERRRIERDLHDGAQHHLVSVSLALGLAEYEVGAGRLGEAHARLDRVLEQLATAEEVLARTATGLSLPALGDGGVVAALRAEFEDDPHVRVDTTGVTVPRFPPEVEAAVWFCCLEAVNNARKHAPGAPVRLWLATAEGSLHFAVRDEGPGRDDGSVSDGQGRGLRNMAARIAAVGGQLTVRSAPGAGTAVEGRVPLADPAPDRAATVAASEPGLLEQVRGVLRAARDLHHATPHAEALARLARRLDQPLRLAVVGPPGPGVSQLVEQLRECPFSRPVAVLAVGGPGPAGADELGVPAADAHVLLLPAPGQTDDASGGLPGPPGRLPPSQTVEVPVGPGSGDGRSSLCELVETRLLARAEALKARTALAALGALPSVAEPRDDVRPLAYALDRIRTSSRELIELDLLDALATGGLPIPAAERRDAERLLGLHGTDLPARLGCGPGVGAGQLEDAARHQLARWRRTAAHPASTVGTRSLAGHMVETCEHLLTMVARPRPLDVEVPGPRSS